MEALVGNLWVTPPRLVVTGVGLWQELVVALSHLVVQYESNFCTVALQFIEEEKNYTVASPANSTGRRDGSLHAEFMSLLDFLLSPVCVQSPET